MRTLDCSQAEELIVAELDTGLDSDRKRALDRHLESCSPCRIFRDETAGLLSSLAEAVPEEPDQEYWQRFSTSLEARLKEAESAREWSFVWQIAAAFVAAIAVVVFLRVSVPETSGLLVEDSSVSLTALADEFQQFLGTLTDDSSSELTQRDLSATVAGGRYGSSYDYYEFPWFETEDDFTQIFL